MKTKSRRRPIPSDVISSLSKFVEIVSEHFPNNEWIFRGQGNVEHKLRPKAGRTEFFLPTKAKPKDSDLTRFSKWSHQAVAFKRDLPENEFERLALAQHYGLATRLLDWTLNAVVALYFATEVHPTDTDGGVFIFKKPPAVKQRWRRIAACRQVMFYQPRPVDQRIIAQDAVFTVHPSPRRPLKVSPFKRERKGLRATGKLVVLRVPADSKKSLQKELRSIGVLARSVYPDIEGLSKSINCQTRWMR